MSKAILNPEAQALWDEYLDQERQRVRSQMLPALDRFIQALGHLAAADQASWALTLCAEVVDNKKQIPVRMPLFRKVLFPVLLSGYRQQMPGCARWLAGFAQLLYNSKECLNQLDPDDRTELALLRDALKVDPEDARVQSRLVHVLAEYLDYTIHEVPSGVLYGCDGATIAECDELIDELSEFSSLAAADGSIEQYRDLVSDCRLHFVAYRDYLRNRDSFASYEEYLERMTETST